MKKCLLVVAALTATKFAYSAGKGPMQPQAPAASMSVEAQESCNRHAQAIDHEEREMGLRDGMSFVDNSAPRHSNLLLEKVASQQRQQMHVQMMINERCPAIPAPEGGARYYAQGVACNVSTGIRPTPESEQKCDITQWTPAPDTPKK